MSFTASQMVTAVTALKEVKSFFPAADRTAPRGIEFDEDTLRCRFCLAESYNFPATRKININKYFNIKHPETYIVKQIRKNDATEEPDFSHTQRHSHSLSPGRPSSSPEAITARKQHEIIMKGLPISR